MYIIYINIYIYTDVYKETEREREKEKDSWDAFANLGEMGMPPPA